MFTVRDSTRLSFESKEVRALHNEFCIRLFFSELEFEFFKTIFE